MTVRQSDKAARPSGSKRAVRLPKMGRNQPRQVGDPIRDREQADRAVDPDALLNRANLIFSARRLRAQVFGKAMFGETGWDLLLALYIDGRRSGRTSVSSLIRLSEAPQTTVLRWLDYLESRGWVDRDREQTNRKQATVDITQQGRAALDNYLTKTLREP